tara:strand:+ start:1060 stop:1335 length:276 start_codon:yes stop_codon:yes gene_type:complete
MPEAKAHSSGPKNESVTTPINAIYTAATLRCVTRPVGDQMGIAFNCEDGSIVRLRVSMSEATQLAQVIRDQSNGSSSNPISDVSSISPVSE